MVRFDALMGFLQRRIPQDALKIYKWAVESKLGDRLCIVDWGVLVNISEGGVACNVDLSGPLPESERN